MTNAPLTVYTTSWCGFCHRLVTVLKSNGISFNEVDIEQEPAAAEFVKQVVPTADLRYFDGGHFVLDEYADEIAEAIIETFSPNSGNAK